MKYTSAARLGIVVAIALGVQGCAEAPTGQVVAIVNGEEITRSELNEEISALPGQVSGEEEVIQREVLEQIVNRRLLVQLAREEGVDRDPTFLRRERSLREKLLVSMYSQQKAETVRVPETEVVERFLADNPSRFANRTAYSVDQIVFDVSNDEDLLKELEQDGSLAEVEATLESFGIEYQRLPNQIDTMMVPSAVLAQIEALPEGEPFVVPSDGRLTVNVIVGSQTIPNAIDEARPLAAREIRATNVRKQLEDRLEDARARATISYQEGFEPSSGDAQPGATK